MTSNTLPSPNVAAASSYPTFDYHAYKAFDKNAATYWSSDGGAAEPSWLSYSWGSGNEKVINVYALTTQNIDAGGAPVDFLFQGWNGSSWDTLDTQAGLSWSTGERKEFSTSNTTAYYSYRVYITEVSGALDTYANVASFQMYFNPAAAIYPGTGSLTITGQAPSLPWSEPGTGSLAVTGQAPTVRGVRSVTPDAGALTITGQAPSAVLRVVVRPGTRHLEFVGQAPSFPATNLAVTLPAISVSFSAVGAYSALTVTLPTLGFFATTGPRSDLTATVPRLTPKLYGGSTLAATVPELSFAGTLSPGVVSTLAVVVPSFGFAARMGGGLAVALPTPSVALAALTGAIGNLTVRLPRMTPAFSVLTAGASTLRVTVPRITPQFAGSRYSNGALTVLLPGPRIVLTGHPGVLSTLAVTVPDLAPVFTSYHDSTSALAVTVPPVSFAAYGTLAGRFDNYVLSFTRPT
jgi:hypothetical protein